jgi:hypothetical protein
MVEPLRVSLIQFKSFKIFAVPVKPEQKMGYIRDIEHGLGPNVEVHPEQNKQTGTKTPNYLSQRRPTSQRVTGMQLIAMRVPEERCV